MTAPAGDLVKASVTVPMPPAHAFELFTADIDQWWRRGPRYRSGGSNGLIHIEPRLGGRLLESWRDDSTERVFEIGRITAWQPPATLAFTWRAINFAASENTLVEISFAAQQHGTLVTVVHRGWADIRPDHPVRHHETTAAFQRRLGTWWGNQLTALRHAAIDRTSK